MFFAQRIRLRPIHRAVIRLIDFIEREIGHVDIGLKAGLERRADAAKTVPIDAAEEIMGFDLRGTGVAGSGAEAVVCGAKETVLGVASVSRRGEKEWC